MKKITVNNGRADTWVNIDAVEKKYNAKYVGQLCLRTKDGGWQGDDCGEVFYQETPPVEGYSNYFALIRQAGVVYIASGASAVEGVLDGVIANDGEIIYSRYRHDGRYSQDRSAFIDGGRDYLRCNVPCVNIRMKIINGEFYQLEEGDEMGTHGE
jgi:hypothetical protein